MAFAKCGAAAGDWSFFCRQDGRAASPVKGRKRAMRILGYATAVSLALGGVAAATLAVKALPDLRRYLKMRSI
jgi:hypothetical protein